MGLLPLFLSAAHFHFRQAFLVDAAVVTYNQERSNTRSLFLWRGGCVGMAGMTLQLRTIAFDAKKCRLRHLGRKLVRDMGGGALLHPLLVCTSGIFFWENESGTKQD